MSKFHGLRVYAIIPALNEEGAIGLVVEAIRVAGADQIIVVDNGSTDQTASEALKAGAHVVSEPKRGYGQACFTGVRTAEAAKADIVIFLDGDGADQGNELSALLRPIIEDRADLVIGARTIGDVKAALPFQQRVGNLIARLMLSLLYRTRLTDIGSFRAIRMDMLLALDMQDRAFGWPIEMIVKSVRLGYRLAEVPVTIRPRVGRSKVSGTVNGTIRAAYGMFRHLLQYSIKKGA
jgi:glycosyltransferase involved in cell wall biosynthesis